MTVPPPELPHDPLLNVPNALSLARIPLAVVVFTCTVHAAWFAALATFAVACVTDWLDGWWARRYGPLSLIGRALDPLTDKVLVCGAFVYLIPVPLSGIVPWMVVVVVSRELVVTGVRGIVEATGQKFGADWFGKLKMGLQCAVLIGVYLILGLRGCAGAAGALAVLEPVQDALVWAMLLATIGSGLQYLVKAVRLLK
ncbi:CDP-alcohol phosphatidyltransferase family protein [Gemmata sp.]|uniref:CDP-alcohol phosphatidyltransferase family protein n=1 Tax=Gemmata sp. TaxID=1914242 RepID=UPI003F729340